MRSITLQCSTKKTVFILGAGASCPYNFPSAYQLTEIILGKLQWHGIGPTWLADQWGNLESHVPGRAQSLQKFRGHLENSNLPSVDQFVFSQPDYAPIAKLLISLVLYKVEQQFMPRGGWLQQLWGEIHQNSDRIVPGNLTIITFNYDRTVEHYLGTRMRAVYFPKNPSHILDAIPMHHVYGSLGRLEGEGLALPYGDAKMTPLTSQIELMRVGQEAAPAVKHAISACDRLVFLGFGFDALNMRALGLEQLSKPAEVLASGYRLSMSRRIAIKSVYSNAQIGVDIADIDNFLFDTPIFT